MSHPVRRACERRDGMTVYLDELFLLNAALNYLLLLGSARLGGGVIRHGRLALAAVLGGVYAAAALWPPLAFFRALGMKAMALALMLLTAFGPARRTVRLGALFLALAFCLGGVTLLCVQLLGTGLLLLSSGAYYPVSMAGLLTLAGSLYLIAYVVFSHIAEHGGGEIVPVTLSLGAHSVQVRALRDTGNTLRDPITNERVLVTDWQTAASLLPEAGLDAERLARPDTLLTALAAECPGLRFRLIPYRAVGTQAGLLLAVRCTAEEKNGKTKQILTAFSPTPVSDGGSFNALTGGVL